jgi:ABC-type multidrug transport system fused ATPase/permease subunit
MTMNVTLQEWLVLIGTAVVALVALWLIATAGEVYGLGIALFAAAVVFGLHWIRRIFDRIDAAGH